MWSKLIYYLNNVRYKNIYKKIYPMIYHDTYLIYDVYVYVHDPILLLENLSITYW